MMRILSEMNKPAKMSFIDHIYLSKTGTIQINGFVGYTVYVTEILYNTLALKGPTGQIDRPESGNIGKPMVSTYRAVDLKFLFSLFIF